MDPNLGDQQQDEEGQSGDDYRQQKRKKWFVQFKNFWP